MAEKQLKGIQVGGKNIPFSDADGNVIGDYYEAKNDANTHKNNKSNPHGVTKAQVGLGNVDNTSDVNKPVSTAQKNYSDAFAKNIAMSVESNGDYNKITAVLKDNNGNSISSSSINLPKATHQSTFHFASTGTKLTSVEGEAAIAFNSTTQEIDRGVLISIYPFNEIHFEQVQLQDSSGNDLDGVDDFIMFPNCYMKASTDSDGSGWTISFSSTKIDSSYARAIEDDTRPYLGLACYKASLVGSYLRSVVGNYPAVNMSNESADSKLPYYNGKKIESQDWRIRMSLVNNIISCFIGDRNTQEIFRGVVDYSWASPYTVEGCVGESGKTGYTNDTLGTGVVTGEITALADGTALTSGKRPFKILGLENIYGLIWENISGIGHTAGVVKAYLGTDHIAKGSALTGYTEISRDDLPLCQSSGWQLTYTTYANAFFPKTVGGDSSHEDGDYYWYDGSELKCFFLGGVWGNGSDAGLFSLNGNSGWGHSYSHLGFRLSL